jgi:hypothetical protein
MVASEVLEAFGGAGYVEDTGLPMLLRDSQVLPIWEGTTNVLALDVLRALAYADQRPTTNDEGGLPRLSSTPRGLVALHERAGAAVRSARDARLVEAGRMALAALDSATGWLRAAYNHGQAALERGARRFALTLGRALELALLVEHAQWSLDHERDGRARAAALRFARSGVDLIVDGDEDVFALANDEALPIDLTEEQL